MSLKTLPLLFINLGGEMLYILDQRLKAQNIPQEKSRKVMHDITYTMFNKRFMEELFKPQELYSKKAMRTVFDRLAHASIMRLNSASMDKLYDLMTMAFKYQISLSQRPNDILLVTLNHMDAIRSFVDDAPNIRQQVDNVYRYLIQHYASLSPGDFMLIRQTLLNFFQDMHIRVSIFLKDKVQNANGRFILPTNGAVPWGCEVPGTIRLFNSSGDQVKTTQFSAGGRFTPATKEGSYDMRGDRVTKLGRNMYSASRSVEAVGPGAGSKSTSGADEPSNPMAKTELDMLSMLLGGGSEKAKKKPEFRLNLFSTDEEEEHAETMRPALHSEGTKVINIDASKKKQSAELSRIMGELNVDGASADYDDDLLDLMDSA